MRLRNTRPGSITLPPDKDGERQELLTGDYDVPDARWEAISEMDSVRGWLGCGELVVIEDVAPPAPVVMEETPKVATPVPPPRVPNEGTSHAMRRRGR